MTRVDLRWMFLLAAALGAAAARDAPAGSAPTPSRPLTAQSPAVGVEHMALDARALEDIGAYTRAAEMIRAIRGRTILDADLELALAINEARAGQLDSAAVRLAGPVLAAAADDTLTASRWVEYVVDRERQWFNGHFDGWHWYVWRARAEVAAARGQWTEAREAALQSARRRANSGKEWLVLATYAGRDGQSDMAQRAVDLAMQLDPTLPEAQYLAGLWHWKNGRRTDAQSFFRHALLLDSTYRAPALALVRLRLPAARPDSLPAEPLEGGRRAALLTSIERPKVEEDIRTDTPISIDKWVNPLRGDTLQAGASGFKLHVSLLVDAGGRVILNDLPWFSPAEAPSAKIARWLSGLPQWRCTPALRNGAPVAAWTSISFDVYP